MTALSYRGLLPKPRISMRTPRAQSAGFDQPDDTRLSRVNYFKVP
jgi:hypothetical protein